MLENQESRAGVFSTFFFAFPMVFPPFFATKSRGPHLAAAGASSAHADLLAEAVAGQGCGLGQANHRRSAQRWPWGPELTAVVSTPDETKPWFTLC